MSEKTTPDTPAEVTETQEEAAIEAPEILTEEQMQAMSADELKAHAEKVEAFNKTAKTDDKQEEIKSNYIKRSLNAQEKAAQKLAPAIKTEDTPAEAGLSVKDQVYLEVNGIAEDSKQAEVLKRYKDAGLISDYKTGINNVGLKAELDAITAQENATAVIDENDTDEVQLQTKKEAIASYRKTGEVPEDAATKDAIVADNLEQMGY